MFPRAEQILELLRENALAISRPLIGNGIEAVREQLRSDGLLDANGLQVALQAYTEELRRYFARAINDPTLRQAVVEMLETLVREAAADRDRHATRH
jgi:hypothetical protein